MLSTVADNEYAIGYVSLGSLNDTVKALKVDGAEPTEENIKSGEYKVARPFNIATKGDVSEVAQDFIDFILSDGGRQLCQKADILLWITFRHMQEANRQVKYPSQVHLLSRRLWKN